MKEGEMRHIANLMADVIEHIDDDSAIERARGEVMELCEGFPLWY
jgi:glycine hydroxymethyltransferase